MVEIVWPTDTETVIDAMRDAIGRPVEFIYTAYSIPCSACSLDPVTGTSDNSFCPICSGSYYIDTISGYTISGVISWGPSDSLRWATGGELLAGDCLLQVKLTDELVDVISKTRSVRVDNRLMEIKKTLRRGARGLNRILISLIEKDNEE
jgi:hypothetical protein